MTNKLIEEASKFVDVRKQFTQDELELCVAFLKGEVSMNGIRQVLRLGKQSGGTSIYSFITLGLEQAYRKGLIKLA